MTRAAILAVFAAGVLLGAVCVAAGFVIGAATTAAEPSRPAPVPSFVPLPSEAGTPPDDGTDAGQAGAPSMTPTQPSPGVPGDDTGDVAASGASPGAPVGPAPTQTPRDKGVDGQATRGSTASGYATWYSVGPGLYAAAGPALRVGDWRGRMVEVCANGTHACLRLRLVDHCACGDRRGTATVLDLSADAFSMLAPLSRGLVEVTVTW